jgi:hypothetical protein
VTREQGFRYAGFVADTSQPTRSVPLGSRWSPRQRTWISVAALLGVLLLAVTSLGVVAFEPRPTPSPQAAIVPLDELDRRWGTYLSEREWGTPREALGADGWGLSWRGAIDTDYRHSDDGIAGLTDADNEYRVSWAFWDGQQQHVTERFYGATNPQGEAGEQILEDRVFLENTPAHSYSRLAYRYPAETPVFDIQLEHAKVDSLRQVMVATVTNTSSRERTLDVVLKAWMAPTATVEPIENGLQLAGEESILTVVGEPPSSWQIAAAKDALDRNLRAGGLTGDHGGHIGALAYRLTIAPESTASVRVGLAETPTTTDNGPPPDPSAVIDSTAGLMRQARTIAGVRRLEARQMFVGEVAEHQELYRQSLMTLLWNESYYSWDGSTGIHPDWAGRVDARDVLIMPDKWEYPWVASWDSAFHAVTASLIDPELAADQLRFILSERWQQPDGHIPCGEWVMDEECPPIFAWAAWRVYQVSRDRSFLQDVYPSLQAHYDYWWRTHSAGDDLFTGGFMGMDNLPRSPGQPQADASAWMAFFARDLVRIASELRDVPSSDRYWAERGRIQDAINAHLWDEETGFYYDRAADGGFVRHKSYSGLVPLIAGVVPADRMPAVLGALRDERQFLSPGGIRSLSAASPLYQPGIGDRGVNSNWRGPVWLPINYLIQRALLETDPYFAHDLRHRLVTMVSTSWQETGRLHEFYDGDTNEGLGAEAQSWTGLVANLISEGWPAE